MKESNEAKGRPPWRFTQLKEPNEGETQSNSTAAEARTDHSLIRFLSAVHFEGQDWPRRELA